MTSFGVANVVDPTTAREPPSRLPAREVERARTCRVRPGSGLAPRRASCAAM